MEEGILYNEYERLENLGIGEFRIIQDRRQFCFGLDAVLLADFATVRSGDMVCDLGTGNGIIPILLCANKSPAKVYGVEIQPASADLALRNSELNNLNNIITIVKGDLKQVSSILPKSGFDAVISNPPYKPQGSGIQNEGMEMRIARHEILCTLNDVVSSASKLLKMGGYFSMVHRPNRLCDIICSMRENKIEPKRLRFVYSKSGDAPSMVLIEGRRGGKAFLKVLPPLYVYNDEGKYTSEIYRIYRREEGVKNAE